MVNTVQIVSIKRYKYQKRKTKKSGWYAPSRPFYRPNVKKCIKSNFLYDYCLPLAQSCRKIDFVAGATIYFYKWPCSFASVG